MSAPGRPGPSGARAGASGAPGRPRIDFNALKPPPGYQPGLGRGAAGFTTRSDIGPARYGAGEEEGGGGQPEAQEARQEQQPEQQFDKFMGSEAGMFSGGVYEEDDKEADKIWDEVEEYMDERRRDQREKRLREEVERERKENPKITEQFRDLKRQLADVSYEQWDGIPEIGDCTVKKQKRFESFVPGSDALLAKAVAQGQVAARESGVSGLETPAGPGVNQDLTSIGAGKKTMLALNLDKMGDDVEGKTTIDPQGYMTAMAATPLASADIQDIKRARQLFKSVISSNPKNPAGWVGAARLEEHAGKLQAARNIIMEGVEKCPNSEDVWLEAVRLQTPDNAKAVLARGVAANPSSVQLWLQAAKLESETAAKARVLRKALERIPASVLLWKAAVDIAPEDDARILLSRAVECCPLHAELWLALAKLETYDNAKKVLNRARQALPTDRSIWLAAAKLEEAQGHEGMPTKIIPRAIKSLEANGVVIDRDQWLEEARISESHDPPMTETCRAIVAAVIGHGVEAEDREATWMGDAEECAKAGAIEAARSIYEHAVTTFPAKKGVWMKAAQLEKRNGDYGRLEAILARAVQFCPQAHTLWLLWAREAWRTKGDVHQARQILDNAFRSNPNSEDIYLAAFKLEAENGETERARLILARARDTPATSTPRMWMYSAKLERDSGKAAEERAILTQAVDRFPDFWKLWLMAAQLEEREGQTDAARKTYARAVLACPKSVGVWRAYAAFEARGGAFPKARAILDMARLRVPKDAGLWLATVRVELASGDTKAADVQLAKALQECPTSGQLWAQAVALASRPQRKSKSAEGLKRCNNDPHMLCAVAQLFVQERKLERARDWFNKSVVGNPDIGDHWAHWYRFELRHGTPDRADKVKAACVAQEPRHGEFWQRVSKEPGNAKLTTEEVLVKVCNSLDEPAPIG